jgi:hypothetical protein
VPSGDIWISTGTTADGSELTVANTGTVISPADAGRIFQPFERLSERTSAGGFGLGLAIVASIAAIHGGIVTARPREDGGLSVTVTIPSAGPPRRSTAGYGEPRVRSGLLSSGSDLSAVKALRVEAGGVLTHDLPAHLRGRRGR